MTNRALGIVALTVVPIVAAVILFRHIGRRRCASSQVKDPGVTSRGVVREIYVYPLKGAAGLSVRSHPLDKNGLRYDRGWALVHRSSREIVRDWPKLLTVKTTLDLPNGLLTFSAAGQHHDLSVPLSGTPGGEIFALERLGATGTVQLESTAAHDWFTSFLGVPVMLVRQVGERVPSDVAEHKGSGARPSDSLNLQAFGSLHAITAASLHWLANVLQHAEPPLSEDSLCLRFRPNLVLDSSVAFEEDRWRRVVLNATANGQVVTVPLRLAKHTGRCSVPTCCPLSGARHRQYEPTRTLKDRRSAFYLHHQDQTDAKREALFGIEFFHESAGVTLSVGDEYVVVETGEPPEFQPSEVA